MTRSRPARPAKWLVPLSMLVVALVAMLIYGRSLSFGFFNDDPSGHFAWMTDRSLPQFFVSSADYGYYRPLVFTNLTLLRALAGGYAAPAFHALLLLLHGANVAMVWLLAFRLGRRHVYAWLAALAFATFPFSYEAVAYVASLTHPLVTFWLLLTLLLYRRGRLAGDRRFYLAAYVTMALGLFSHENGVFIPPALAGVDWLLHPPRSRRWQDWIKRPFRPFFVAPVLYLALWVAVPKTGTQSAPTLDRIGRNLIPTLQTLVYPLLPALRLSTGETGWLAAAGVVTLIGTFWLARRACAVGLWAFALGWLALSSAPSILLLETDYFYGSPRLHYLPSVGAALLWGIPLLALVRLPLSRLAKLTAQTALTLAIILPPLPFINCQLDFYAQVTDIVTEMAERAKTAPPERELLFVNVPFFFSSYTQRPQGCPNPYPWTPQGGIVIPPYAAARDFVRFNGGPDRPATAVSVPAYHPGWTTHGPGLDPAGLRARLGDAAIFVFDLETGSFVDLTTAWQPDAEPVTLTAKFGGVLALGATAVSRTETAVTVTLPWQVLAPPERPLTVFVHLYDDAGGLVTQHDGPPVGGFVPWTWWQPGDVLVDEHAAPLSAPLSAGTYRVGVGVYDPATGERLPATTPAGPPPDDVYIVTTFTMP